ncbi:hypothetical protein [Prevotella bivia]|uniref:hypothetical protein n=1 Tax=Prevotella bivia TaxID=28125 RepID=UPI0007E0E7FF|nr:hypothetical protein [Prevotella bivia]KXU58189.1 hypothetical protein HMPREF3218_0201170 [Prevotella bivia]
MMTIFASEKKYSSIYFPYIFTATMPYNSYLLLSTSSPIQPYTLPHIYQLLGIAATTHTP